MVVLCERSQLQDLVEFPYVNLHNEVISRCWEEEGHNCWEEEGHTTSGRKRGTTALFLKGLLTQLSLCVLQVVGIIESHARAVDLMTHNYYELLYAFHIYRHNYRKGKARGGHVVTARVPGNTLWGGGSWVLAEVFPFSPQLER